MPAKRTSVSIVLGRPPSVLSICSGKLPNITALPRSLAAKQPRVRLESFALYETVLAKQFASFGVRCLAVDFRVRTVVHPTILRKSDHQVVSRP